MKFKAYKGIHMIAKNEFTRRGESTLEATYYKA